MTITYKVFAAGDTLTANDLLDYIENQVVVQVDNETELATVHSTYPDVRVAFAEDTDKLYVKDDGVWNPVVAGVSPTLTNLTLTGNLTVQGSTTTIDSTTIAVKDKFVFEGATANDFETTLQVAEPTADRTVTIPDATTTLVGTDATQTLTNKTISGANNTLSAIGNASLTNSSITMDGTPVSLGGTFTSPASYSLPSQTGNSGKFLTTNGTADSWGTVDLTTKTDKSTLDATGAMYYASAANTPAKLAIGTANDVLRVSSGGIPEWAAPASGSTFAGASATTTTAQSLLNNTTTVLNFPSENFDVGNYHDNSTNNTRLTVPAGKAGYYQLNGSIHFSGNANGTRSVGFVSRNSSNTQTGGWDIRAANVGTSQMFVQISAILYGAVGDYFTVTAEQSSGSTLDAQYSTFQCALLGA